MKNLDILLLNPSPQPSAGLLYKLSGILHPLGLGYIASHLLENGFKVEILDNTIERLSKEQFKAYLGQRRPGCLGLSLYTGCLSNAFSFAAAAKEVNSQIKIIAGGPHASALPRDVLHQEAIDLVVKGEGEVTALELLKAFENNQSLNSIKGIVYKDEGKIIENPNRELIADIDNLPLPAYELLPMKRYSLAPSRRFTGKRVGSIITSRGCPQRCSFCSRAVFGQTVRYRSPESVVREIKYLMDNHDIKEIEFRDDTFTLDEDRAIAICDLIEKNELGIIWNCCSRADRSSDKLFRAFYRAGCRAVFVGAESGSQAILNSLKKDITLQEIEKAVKQCRKHNMLSLVSFMVGTPQETEDTIKETIKFAKSINPDYVSFCAFTPLPGSQLFDQIVAKGLINIKNTNWENYLRLLLVSPPPQTGYFSGEELVKWQRKALRQFYFRPQYIVNRLKKIRSYKNLYPLLLGLYIIIGHQLRRIKFPNCKRA